MNEIVFCMDSPGKNEFFEAKTPNINKFKPESATSYATFTMPSIQAMLRGSMPVPMERRKRRYRPYKEYCKSEHSIIPLTLANKGYNTYLITANINISNSITKFEDDVVGYLPWFQNEHKNFDSGLSGLEMVTWFLKNMKEPFYAFFLFIDTHTPYLGLEVNDPDAQKRKTQILAIEYLDKVFKVLYDGCPKDTRIIVTSDHSDGWKDGVRYGHNPEHYRTAVKKDLLLDLLDVFVVEAIK